MRTIRWGIIGCGDVTEVKSGPGFQKAQHSALAAVMRRNGDLAADYARRHNVPRWYDDAEALIHDPEVDAVYIATPPNVHKEYTLMAAAAGKPVYVEKPMAMNFAECQTMIAACQDAGVPLFVAYYRRALPRFLKIQDLLSSIGEVRFVRLLLQRQPRPLSPDDLPWRVQPHIAGGGHFVDLASHMLDILDFLLGRIKNVQGFASNQGSPYPAEDMVSGSFVFENGVHGVGTWSFSAYEDADLMEIVGSAGKISCAIFGTDPITLTKPTGITAFPITNPPHIQQPLIQTIVNQLNGVGTCPSSGESAARTSQVMDAFLRDYYSVT